MSQSKSLEVADIGQQSLLLVPLPRHRNATKGSLWDMGALPSFSEKLILDVPNLACSRPPAELPNFANERFRLSMRETGSFQDQFGY